MSIREEEARDIEHIRRINDLAFNQTDESEIVRKLREHKTVLHSLVYEEDGMIIGHLMLSRGFIKNDTQSTKVVALGPIAVHPAHQKRGIGKKLIRHSIEVLKSENERIIILLGHTSYYPKFGFEPAIPYNIFPSFKLSNDHQDSFMVLFLDKSAKNSIIGIMYHDDAFNV